MQAQGHSTAEPAGLDRPVSSEVEPVRKTVRKQAENPQFRLAPSLR